MKIGILLPPSVDLGLLRRAHELSGLIGDCRTPDGARYSVAVGLPDTNEAQWQAREAMLREGNPHVVVRHLKWESVPVSNAQRMFAKLPAGLDLDGIEGVVVGRDWGWNFSDCDAAIVFADPGLGAVLPVLPLAFYCPDLAVRIVPEAFASSIHDPFWVRQTAAFRIWRQSTVLTSDPASIDDIVSYAGVRRERVVLMPNLLAGNPPADAAPSPRDPLRLVWLVSPSVLHDLETAARGLETYLAEGGTLRPVLVGEDVAAFEPQGRVEVVQSLPDHLADLLYSLPKLQVRSDRELYRLLRRSGVLWSSLIAGGEGEAAILAGQSGTAFVGADYQINRATLDPRVPARLYDFADPLAVADALHQAEASAGRMEPPVSTASVSRRDRVEEIGFVIDRLLEHTLAE